MTLSVLLTGASSFTGLWFAEALARRGVRVVAPLRGAESGYEGVRGRRVARLKQCAEVVFDCPFATDAFMALVENDRFDVVAHHASDVEGYNRWDFDALRAVGRNAGGADRVLAKAAERGARAIVATGTVFEAAQGGAPAGSLSANPYGLSKYLSGEALRHFAAWSGLAFGKFVVANPFGPYEERRFGWYLFQTWFGGETPVVRTPDYVRDNVPVPLLAEAYADYVVSMAAGNGAADCRPSGIVGSQGSFARLLAGEASSRLGKTFTVDIGRQEAFSEPYLRVNDQLCVTPDSLSVFWDSYVEYYDALHASGELN
ncbi:NAD-dependent epimerase/dehydratase family protein [Caulobacter endophyticus]|uniref:NAD-dependent epimerase/dehydratase family protein n=1 Tax=Caulobacter endophyticus TaxID=2172652 RepID=UPI0024109187|nr:NAD(P)-dependent oxidoreductase [Caulobacter endophyticus]MDG2528803.1 NAD(P)-dependent oxidoreductase [Caulobacter endophyticus]